MRHKLKNHQYNPKMYVIYKELKKSPKAYKGDTQAHVNVVKRLMAKKNLTEASFINHTIGYVICKPTTGGQSSSQCAYHLTEVFESKGTPTPLEIDTDWYANNQINNPIGRILEHVEGVDLVRVAESIGIDKSKFSSYGITQGVDVDDEAPTLIYPRNARQYYQFKWKCNACTTDSFFDDKKPFSCVKCGEFINYAQAINTLRRIIKNIVKDYYSGGSKCNSCNFKAQGWSLTDNCIDEGCDGKRIPDTSELLTNGNIHKFLTDFLSFKKHDDVKVEQLVMQLEMELKEVKELMDYERINFKEAIGGLKEAKVSKRISKVRRYCRIATLRLM